MSGCPSVYQIGSTLGIECIVGLNPSKSFDEVGTVNQNCAGHTFFLRTKTPKGLARPGWLGRLTALGGMGAD